MFFDWNGNGRKDDMFDNYMDYMMINDILDTDDDKDGDEEDE